MEYTTGIDKLDDYRRKKLLGRIIRRLIKSKTISEHCSSKCWLHTGRKEKDGYIRIKVRGKITPMRVHRIMYELNKGGAGDLLVCHTCDEPICCNPDHLFLGTHKDNAIDMVKKGRALKREETFNVLHPELSYVGEINGNNKFDKTKILEVIDLRKKHLTITEISEKTDVSRSHVCRIINGKSWEHLFAKVDDDASVKSS